MDATCAAAGFGAGFTAGLTAIAAVPAAAGSKLLVAWQQVLSGMI
ncbi:MAG TPA: hypothetical protein PKB14_11985 [Rubrivivax sp.]|nr:hypothetical protein [Rubrivivax sp.]